MTKRNIKTLGIGVFDGLHLGHRVIAEKCDTLLTFSPHPDLVLNKTPQLKRLTTIEELQLLCKLIDKTLITLRFSKKVATLSPTEFLNTYILSKLKPSKIIVGYDFRFGKKKEGTIPFLIEWAKTHDISVSHIEPVQCDNKTIIKSSLIRQYLKDGAFDKACEYLGHPYLISGRVIPGEGRGHHLGFPTANIQTKPSKLIPKSGVYSGNIKIGQKHYPCMIYIGKKPTFNNNTLSIEVHIPYFNKNIYGKQVHVFMEKKIRDEMTFLSSSDLVKQIKKDLISL